jgi:PAS domain S-box-containing protein
MRLKHLETERTGNAANGQAAHATSMGELEMQILIVDDDAIARKLLRINLESCGATVIEAGNGQEGIELARRGGADLIVSDALMPVMDGFQFLRTIKTDVELKSIPFVFRSAVYAGSKDEELALALGAAAFIDKTAPPEELWQELSAVMRRVEAGEETATAAQMMGKEEEYLKEYSQLVAAKLEEKVRELEEALALRKEAEKALKESEKFLNTIIDTEPECVKLLAADGSIQMMNRSGLDLIEADSFDQVRGRSPYPLVDPEYREAFEALTDEVFRGNSGNLVFRMTGLKGRNLWLDTHAVPLRNDAGEIVSLLGITRNITERRQIEEKNLRLAAIVESSDDVIIGKTLDGIITDWNGGAERTYGYREEEIVGRPISVLVSADRAGEVPEILGRIREGQHVIQLETQRRKKDGSLIHMSLTISPLRDAQGRIVGACSVGHDISARKKAEEKIRRQMENLAALRTIDTAINSSLDLRITLSVLLQQTLRQLRVDAACVLLFNPHSQMLEYAAGDGFLKERITTTGLKLGQGYAGRAALERKSCIVPEIAATGVDLAPTTLIAMEEFEAYVGVPLIAKGQIKGVLEIYQRSPLQAARDWLEFAEALAGQAAIAIDNAEMYDFLQRSHTDLLMAYDTTLEGWARALDFRDKETEGHSRRVTEMTWRLAKAIGIRSEEMVHIRRGALLHDIGKLGVPDQILLKPGALTGEEKAVMQEHPSIAFKLLSPIPFLRPAVDIPYCHHEKWDGSGYPQRLQGEEIPLGARLFAVIDVWDALRSNRPYRPAWPEQKVREHIRSLAGSHFDPDVAETFLAMEL